MGGGSSRRRRPPASGTNYSPPGSPGISRTPFPTTAPLNPGIGASGPINRNQQQELMVLNQTVANLSNQLQALQRAGAGAGALPQIPYGAYPTPGALPPYGIPPLGAQSPYAYPPLAGSGPPAVYRDTDFASIANIAGLNPADVAVLHREFINLTRGGSSKMDRVVFRQLLRDVLLQANNEHVDRVIEDMFVNIDRNHDGFIDFPEFVGAFKEVLKDKPSDPYSYFNDNAYPDLLGNQLRAAGVGAGIDAQPISYMQQTQPITQVVSPGGLSVVPLASAGIQQMPIFYGGAAPLQFSDASAPLLTLDPNQSSYVIATPGQYLITQPTALQCMPLPRI